MTKALSLKVKTHSSFLLKEVEQRVVLHYVRLQTNSNKFYIMEFQSGVGEWSYRIYTEYGRMGGPPRKHERCFQTRLEARNQFDKILSSKRKKGYELIFIDEESDDLTLLPLEAPQNKTTRSISPSATLSIHSPLGKLSSIQLQKGMYILNEIEMNIMNGTHDVIDLTNHFYSIIPVVFENQLDRRYLLDTLEKVQTKKDWLLENLRKTK